MKTEKLLDDRIESMNPNQETPAPYSVEAKLPPISEILTEALRQKPDLFEKVGQEKVLNFITQVRGQMIKMEDAVHLIKDRLPQTPAEAAKIKAIVVISAAGTYLDPFKEDSYKQWAWSEWMDHRRIEHAAYLIRRITEIKTGETLANNPQKFREIISKEGPYLLYSGRPDEQEAILKALEMPNIYMPKDKVKLIGEKLTKNTVDQAQRFYIPKEVGLKPDDKIGLVLHSPQAVRFAYNLQKAVDDNQQAEGQGLHKPFPDLPFADNGPILRMYPLSIPVDPATQRRTTHYPTLEICALIHYAFYANPPVAAEKPYPYEL